MVQSDLVLLHAPSVYDFRKESILYGPISDLVPSSTVFEMYPIGFTTIAEYLERHGWHVRIVNLAVRMLRSRRYDPERTIRSLNPLAFGIDLHWMPHVHGALEVARLVKKHHPQTPVILGGFSASYFAEELVQRPEVDFVVRGDSTEEPVRLLMEQLRAQARGEPLPHAWEAIPNLTWTDAAGQVHQNPITFSPPNLDHVMLDYSYVVRAVARYLDLASFIPFGDWLRYPITAALTVRGCTYGCKTCGGSRQAYRRIHNRAEPAFRSPEDLVRDIRNIGRFSNGPIFILGDLRQPGEDYALRVFDAIGRYEGPVIVELFDGADRGFLERLARAFPNFTLEISPESHDERVRHAFGRPYTNAALEATLAHTLEVGARRVDVYFMIGLPYQTYGSVMGTIDYCEHLLQRFTGPGDRRLFPFISPLAPFLDPGSEVWEAPEKYGYRLFWRTAEEHRRALVQPSWKYVLNYETEWMTREEIVAATYEAGLRLNRLKAKYGLLDPEVAAATERRIRRAVRLMEQIDDILSIPDEGRRARLLSALKPQVDGANHSTVCEKRELELPLSGLRLNLPKAATIVLDSVLGREDRRRRRSEAPVGGGSS
jgi:B12-binding domain/radical SAM domain protein